MIDPLPQRIRALCRPLAPQPTGQAPRLPRLDGVRAVLFDVYGTLLVSGSGDVGTAAATDSATALVEALAGAGCPAASADAGPAGVTALDEAVRESHARARADGVDWPEVEIRDVWRAVLDRLAADGLVGAAVASDCVERLAVEYECRVNPTWPMPDAAATLDLLRTRGLRLGIVSNAQFYTPLLFEALLDEPPEALGFAPALCSWSYRVGAAKPSLRMFEAPLRALAVDGITAGETLYVGNDMRNDVWTAARAGCRTALFAGDRRSLRLREDDPNVAGWSPDVVLTDLRSLGEVLPG